MTRFGVAEAGPAVGSDHALGVVVRNTFIDVAFLDETQNFQRQASAPARIILGDGTPAALWDDLSVDGDEGDDLDADINKAEEDNVGGSTHGSFMSRSTTVEVYDDSASDAPSSEKNGQAPPHNGYWAGGGAAVPEYAYNGGGLGGALGSLPGGIVPGGVFSWGFGGFAAGGFAYGANAPQQLQGPLQHYEHQQQQYQQQQVQQVQQQFQQQEQQQQQRQFLEERRERKLVTEEILAACRQKSAGSPPFAPPVPNIVLTPEQLRRFHCHNERLLVSVYGRIFDVSSASQRYGPGGCQSYYTGKDITWALITGRAEDCNRFYDVFKLGAPKRAALRELCSNLVNFEREFGAPVAQLSVYVDEAVLSAPPLQEMVESCCVQ